MQRSDSFKSAAQVISQQIDKIDIKQIKRLIQTSQVYKIGKFWHIGQDYQFDYEGGELFKKQDTGKPKYLYTVEPNDLEELDRYCEMRQSILEYKTEHARSESEIKDAVKYLKRLIQTSQVYKIGKFWHIGQDYQFDYEGGELFKKQDTGKPKYLYTVEPNDLEELDRYCEMRQSVILYNQKQAMTNNQ